MSSDRMIQEIEDILRQRQVSVKDMEKVINQNRTKIKKITTNLDKVEAKLVDLVVELTDTSSVIDTVDDELSEAELTKRIKEINVKLPNRKLKVVEIPDDVKWYIANHHQGEGEYIVEEHRTWK